jgi:hypothetical protein
MKATLPALFLQLCRATTPDQRRSAIWTAMQKLYSRFDRDELRALEDLHRESAHAPHVLRPLPAASIKQVILLEPGPAPDLPPHLWPDLQEWTSSWNRSFEMECLGIPPPGPLLLHGETGGGKTMLTRHLVSLLAGREAVVLDAHRCIESHLGESARRLDDVFQHCERSGALLVIEELDAFSTRRTTGTNSAEQENTRVTVAFMRLMDTHGTRIPIIGTTNRPELLDPAHRRRFELEMDIPAPSLETKNRVLTQLLRGHDVPLREEWLQLPLTASLAAAKREIRRTWLTLNPPPTPQ